MANETQRYNDHRLHIEPCLCGNPSPEISGDDFDASVDCAICNRSSEGYGTKGAIHWWNKKTAEHKTGIAEFPAHMPWPLQTILEKANELETEALGWESYDHTKDAVHVMKECAEKIRETVEETWKNLRKTEVPFQKSSEP
jgi:hypothetical protein